MNLKKLLTSEGRLKFRIDRNTKKLSERYAQHEARMEALDKLRDIGTPDAIYGLARRFSATSENLGLDQEEKKRVQDVLIAFGDRAIEPIQRYMVSYDKVTWAIGRARAHHREGSSDSLSLRSPQGRRSGLYSR